MPDRTDRHVVDVPVLAEGDIAIVGMSGRFPGAPGVDELWERVRRGDDCLVDLAERDLLAAGIDRATLADDHYVRRNGVVEGVDMFDPGFFGIGRRDAALMDPQHRLLLECVWEAIETAGHVPERFAGSIGVFAGCGANTYLLHNVLTNPQLVDELGWFLIRHTGNDKDFLATGISYQLDLRGPSVNVQTACSTSLVAVHLAVQSLLGFECDMAIAGGSTIEVPHGVGYRYQEGEILSPTGRCRAFDRDSEGTVLTSGAGAVALRRAADAVTDGDPILAVIKASAVNNDGSRKVGFLAPSVDGHADVVREALELAEIDARTITLLEAHGTGTAVGDPIEAAALTDAFRTHTEDRQFCRLASTKPNIGHLDTAAGVASLIKTVQALRHRELPPLANHTCESPLLDLERTPFVVSNEVVPWEVEGVRRAGVSSLGVGGTNAHVIVEEPPVSPPSLSRAEQALCLSAHTPEALAATSERLATFLERHPDIDLGDVAHTLAEGRRSMTHRRVVAATDRLDAVVQLRSADRSRSHFSIVDHEERDVVFLLPGGGAQYPGMAAGLDERFAEFHRTMTTGIELVGDLTGVDLRPCFKPDADLEHIRRADVSLPAVFLTEVALARQWMEWGIAPRSLVGHSLGEYAAAHLAGVLTLDDAVRVVSRRAQLMGSVGGEGTAMLSVAMPPAELAELLSDAVSLAVVNTPEDCVVSGPRADIDALAAVLAAGDIDHALLPLALAAHSRMLDPILDEFRDFMRTIRFGELRIPYVSNLTGGWIRPEEATSADYWARHLRGTVRFADNLATVLADGPVVMTELGPGQALSSFARRMPTPPIAAIPGLRHPSDPVDDTAYTIASFARLWANGVTSRPSVLVGGPAQRIRLPATAFDRQRCWIEPGPMAATTGLPGAGASSRSVATVLERIDDLADWGWETELLDAGPPRSPSGPSGPWLVLGDLTEERCAAVVDLLRARGDHVETAPAFDMDRMPADTRSVCVVAPRRAADDAGPAAFDVALRRVVVDAAKALRALAGQREPTRFVIVTDGALRMDEPSARPEHALALGPVLAGGKEYPYIECVAVDADDGTPFDAIIDEIVAGAEPTLVLREGRRLRRELRRRRLEPPATAPFRTGGRYVVTGGLGQIGFAVAEHLAAAYEADVAVVTTAELPAAADRATFLATHGAGNPTARRLRRLERLQAHGGRVEIVRADLADPAGVRRALDEAEASLGSLDGVVHAAGRLQDRLIENVEPADHEAVVGVKARAAVSLVDELVRRGASQLILVSSTSTVLAPAGQTSYVAANAVLDALAGRHGSLDVATVGFGVWSRGGMAVDAARRAQLGVGDGEPIEHHVFHERTSGDDGVERYIGALDAAHDWLVDEHRIEGRTAVLPGTGHLELMLSALSLAGLVPTLERVALVEPLVVADEAPTAVRLTIDAPDEVGMRMVRVESDRGAGAEWVLHSEAEHVPDPMPVSGIAPSSVAGTAVDPLERPRRHLRLGARWSAVRSAAIADGQVVAQLELDTQLASEASRWVFHPGLADVATACAAALDERTDDVLFVPVAYGAVISNGPLDGRLTVTATRMPESTADVLVADIRFVGAEGEVRAAIDGLELRAVTDFDHLPGPPDVGAGPATTMPTLLSTAMDLGIRPDEGVDGLSRAVGSGAGHMLVSSVDLALIAELDRPDEADDVDAPSSGEGGLVGVVVSAFEELLGVSPVPADGDFFELGGHSLIAIRLLTRLHKTTGVRLQLSTMFEVPTPSALADRLLEEDASLAERFGGDARADAATRRVGRPVEQIAGQDERPRLHPSLVPVRARGDRRPLFVVHGAGGNVLNLWGIAKHLPPGRPIYGLQAEGIDGATPPDPTIEAMAARYIGALRSVQSTGPYLLGGYSGGGVVALEMSRQLKAVAEDVSLIVMLDTVPRNSERPSAWRRYANVLLEAIRNGPRAVEPWVQYSLGMRYGWIPDDVEALGLGFGDVSEHGVVNLADHFEAAVEAYQIAKYDVDVVIAKAEKVYPAWPWHYKWKRRIRGRIDTFVSPGNHFEMFTPENAPVLAERLAPYLEAADAE